MSLGFPSRRDVWKIALEKSAASDALLGKLPYKEELAP
jgi:hypothetical protein